MDDAQQPPGEAWEKATRQSVLRHRTNLLEKLRPRILELCFRNHASPEAFDRAWANLVAEIDAKYEECLAALND
jgi:hypothetical protein